MLVGQLFESTNTGCFSITGALNILRGIQYRKGCPNLQIMQLSEGPVR